MTRTKAAIAADAPWADDCAPFELAGSLWILMVLRELDIFGMVPGTMDLGQLSTLEKADILRWRNGRIGVSIMVMG